MNVEAVEVGCARLFHGDQGGTAFLGNEAEDRILRVLTRVGEIDPRGEALQEARSHNTERDVWRLQRVARTGHTARTDGAKTERAFLVRGAAAKADEGGIKGGILARIFGMCITPRRVGLPDLDQGIDDRRAFVVPETAGQFDSLTERVVAARLGAKHRVIMSGRDEIGARPEVAVTGQIGGAVPGQAEMQERPGRLPRGLPSHAYCSIGVASRPRSTKSNR